VTVAQLPIPDLLRRSAKRTAADGEEIFVDLFAGGGGASMGIEHATGRDVDEAVNHDAEAIDMHTRNHPRTRHHRASVWEIDPVKVARGRRVGLLWLSPDCKDFSRAKGGQPIRNKRIRALAWVGCRWARDVRPRVIMLENVREFEEWGPLIQLVKNGRPQFDKKTGKPLMIRNPAKKGETFKRFVGQLRRLGYQVEYRVLNAADYGAPTIRKRFFMIARCDGLPIVWPERTHAPVSKVSDDRLKLLFGNSGSVRDVGVTPKAKNTRKNPPGHQSSSRLLPYRTAAECIDWSLPCPSIFGRKKPLAPNTQRRIAMGLKRYVFDIASPFVVQVNHGGAEFRGQPIYTPVPTITQRHGFGVVAPCLRKPGDIPHDASRCPHCGFEMWLKHAKCPCCLKPLRPDPEGPSAKHASSSVVAPHISKFYGGVVGSPLTTPLPTITSIDHNAIASAFLTRCAHGESGRWGHGTLSAEGPVPTLTASKDFALTSISLVPFVAGVGGRAGQSPATPGDGPIGTITAKNDRAVIVAHVTQYFGGSPASRSKSPAVPLPTITADDHNGLVFAHLTHYHTEKGGEIRASDLTAPIPTQDTSNRFGVVTASIIKNTVDAAAGKPCQGPGEPLHTITTIHNKFQLLTATLTPFLMHRYGEAPDQPTRAQAADTPINTITPSNNTGVLIAPTVTRIGQSGGNGIYAYGAASPLTTITTKQEHLLTTAFLTKLRGSGGWKPADRPLDTIVASATTFAVTTPVLTILRNHADGRSVDAPAPTLTAAGNHVALVSPFCVSYYGQGVGQPLDTALRTVTTHDRFGVVLPRLTPETTSPHLIGRAADVYAFLVKFRHLIGTPPNATFHDLPDGTGYVTVRIGDDEYLMTDIGLRMLTPRELLRAQFSPELAEDYVLPKSNAAAVHKIGNSVPPLVVSALVAANLPDLIVKKRRRSA
jgi:DNA (cytosine-5)-methyltransferase 1